MWKAPPLEFRAEPWPHLGVPSLWALPTDLMLHLSQVSLLFPEAAWFQICGFMHQDEYDYYGTDPSALP